MACGLSRAIAAVSLLVGLASTGNPAQAGDRFQPPFDLAWGATIDEVPHREDVAVTGNIRDAILEVAARGPDIHNVIGVFCDGAGLQQLRIVSPRYDTFDLPRKLKRRKAELAAQLGPPDDSDPDDNAATWADRVILAPHRATKTKYYLLTLHNGPEYPACAARQATLTN